MHDKNKDTKSFTDLRKYYLNGYFFWQYCQEPDLEPDQKSMVELFLQKFISVCLRRIFFHLGDRIKVPGRVRQVVVLYSNDCKGFCLDGLSIGRLWLNVLS